MEFAEDITIAVETDVEFCEGVLGVGLADFVELYLISDHAVEIAAESIGDAAGL